jgi:hypothetical protein
MVHAIHHWNYLGFNVYFFNDIHVDISMDSTSHVVMLKNRKMWLEGVAMKKNCDDKKLNSSSSQP